MAGSISPRNSTLSVSIRMTNTITRVASPEATRSGANRAACPFSQRRRVAMPLPANTSTAKSAAPATRPTTNVTGPR